MFILTIRTDKPEAEIGLYADQQQLVAIAWQAHRELAETIHVRIQELLNQTDKTLQALEGVVVFKGPGSFTGLRIGLSVANALADSLQLPIVSTQGEQWANDGIQRLEKGDNEKLVLPEYGSLPHTTQPKK